MNQSDALEVASGEKLITSDVLKLASDETLTNQIVLLWSLMRLQHRSNILFNHLTRQEKVGLDHSSS